MYFWTYFQIYFALVELQSLVFDNNRCMQEKYDDEKSQNVVRAQTAQIENLTLTVKRQEENISELKDYVQTLVNKLNNTFVQHTETILEQYEELKDNMEIVLERNSSFAKLEEKLSESNTGISNVNGDLRPNEEPGIERPQDCKALYSINSTLPNGVYDIFPSANEAVAAFCDMESSGWTVFQRRFTGETDFYRGWQEYRNGFGSPSGEYWLGNKYLHQITKGKFCILLIEMMHTLTNSSWNTEFLDFKIDNETEGFRISFSQSYDILGKGLESGAKFTTFDKDNDEASTNCAFLRKGAWWYTDRCQYANLNGYFENERSSRRVYWVGLLKSHGEFRAYMKETTMKVKCVDKK